LLAPSFRQMQGREKPQSRQATKGSDGMLTPASLKTPRRKGGKHRIEHPSPRPSLFPLRGFEASRLCWPRLSGKCRDGKSHEAAKPQRGRMECSRPLRSRRQDAKGKSTGSNIPARAPACFPFAALRLRGFVGPVFPANAGTGKATKPPSHKGVGWNAHARFAQDAKTQRGKAPDRTSQPAPQRVSPSRLCVFAPIWKLATGN
jgi:hypothetical protein